MSCGMGFGLPPSLGNASEKGNLGFSVNCGGGGINNESEADYVEKCPRNRYLRYNDVLGKGAFKTVYKAFDQFDGIEVAWNRVKIDDVLRSPEDLEKLYSEGVKPASLNKVASPQIKEFIEKCLVPASQRLSAKELLKEPFLQFEHSKEPIRDSLRLPNEFHQPASSLNCGPHCMDIDHEYNQSMCTDSNSGSPHSSVLEFQRSHQNNEFRLKGKKIDDNSISLTLRIADQAGRVRNIHFQFYLDSDTALAVAAEMVEQLDLADHDVAFIADFIDSVVMEILPDWKASFESHSGGERSPSSLALIEDQWEMPFADFPYESEVEQDNVPDFQMDPHIRGNNSYENSNFVPRDPCMTNTGNKLSHGSMTSEVTAQDCSLKNEMMSKGSSQEISEMEFRDEYFECRRNETDRGIVECPLIAENSKLIDESDLKLELEAIETQYQQWFEELSRMRQEAMEATKKKWMTKKKASVH
ncbi:hypothetical protein RD792_015467 [Penstemon davidsonii]|uniref:non-specific serine/threonine protein kinase n=1 Tax=Penstemon davidsonii TaxID=160366 RepID=A0ABR0CGW9_9LAMI|nr:hypothetical protein RD792_015467 [Penstemon davidsonii]